MRLDLSDTIVALATPPGRGAIGVIRLSGPAAFEIADQIFSGKKLSAQPTHTAHFGHLRTREGKELDEALATIFHGKKSYTGQPTVEFSCHGSPFILQKVIELCLAEGARLAEPGEYTLRAFLNGKLDLSQAEAVADLIASESEAAHAVALNQLRGGFRKEIEVLRDELIHFASLVELELDFSEEDVEFADRTQLKDLVLRIRKYLGGLIQSFALGNAIKTGVTTVIAGRPNAGKSTLLNALLNEARAIVSDIPGTTRDTIEEVLNINGIQFRLVDTAGIREAQDQIEAIGVQRTLDKVREASVLMYVWDVAGGMTLQEVFTDLQQLRGETMKLLVVCNKMDRNPHFQTDWLVQPEQAGIHPYLLGDPPAPLSAYAGILEADQLVPISAKNEQNIALIREKLFELASGGELNLESTVVSSARHFDALQRAEQALQDVLYGLDTGITGDFIAQDIRRALACLGEITGEIGVEDLLANIFGKFCIGK